MFDPDTLPVPDLGLSCPGCGYPLAGLTEHRCPECGRGFEMEEFVPKGDMPPLFADGRAVRGTPDVVALLEAYQVPFVRLTGPVEAVLGGYLGPALNGPAATLGVPRSRYLESIDLLRRTSFGEPLPEPPDPPVDGAEWPCPACGEENPSNFELCWNCEAER